MRILPTQNIFDNGGFVSLGLIGLDISATQRPEVIQNNMNGDIKRLTGSQGDLVTLTHSTNGKACPDQNVPSITRVAASAFVYATTLRQSARHAKAYARMTNKHASGFTPSDDALILQQPVTRIGLKTLAKMIHTSQEMIICRAGELRVSLIIRDDYDEALDTRALRCSDTLIDPLLQKLKQVHSDPQPK